MSLSALRNPAHTGARRCWPCTVANLGLLGLACAALALVWPPAAGALAVVGLAAVYLRGYLVPYTPRFAPRLAAWLPVPDGLFRADHGRPEAGSLSLENAGGDPDADGEAVLAALVDAGVVVPDGEMLSLAPAFRERWRDEMAALRRLDDGALAAAAREASPAAAADVRRLGGEPYVVLSDGSGDPAREAWLPRPVAIAETAAARALAARGGALPVAPAAAARPLRTFLEECPDCGGPIEETTLADCCGTGPDPTTSPETRVLACADCGARLFTFPE